MDQHDVSRTGAARSVQPEVEYTSLHRLLSFICRLQSRSQSYAGSLKSQMQCDVSNFVRVIVFKNSYRDAIQHDYKKILILEDDVDVSWKTNNLVALFISSLRYTQRSLVKCLTYGRSCPMIGAFSC